MLSDEQMREHERRKALRHDVVRWAIIAEKRDGFLQSIENVNLRSLLDEMDWDDLYAVLDTLTQHQIACLINTLAEGS